ncbi:RNA polymerase sigma factor [Micromonospora sp. MS34]|uniref:RNA polymerase sigma factor n=1 Tax=Micromonospora sp. MS34 TaxID=3385971 RepID=UPI0039A0F929
MSEPTAALDRVWRAEVGSMLGVLTRRLGDLDLAEDALQDAVGEALRHWPTDGVPEHPSGWLVTVAWRKALDRLRRDATGRAKAALLARTPPAGSTGDDRLALLFACCHPGLAEPAQVALTLNAVSGLSAEQIAAAYLVPTATMAQRLVRAKRQLRRAGVRFDLPPAEEYAARLRAVLAVVYLVFNEGYLASSAETPQRRDLAREALDLALQLVELMPREPEVAGLAALLELHEARAATRFDAAGRIVLLEQQDRRRWDAALIGAAVARLRRAAAPGTAGPYQLQAAIAAQHALAPSVDRTDWTAVRALYDRLDAVQPTPVVRLGRAVATRYTHGPAVALAEVDALGDRLTGYRLWHATRAELLRALGRDGEAVEATRRALALATNPAERELLARRLAA